MGMPGAGKGMQSKMLSEKTGYPIFSTGGEMRVMAKKGGVLGDKIREIMDSGGLTPAWLASYVFQRSLLETPLDQGKIFEGVGRKRPEAELFGEACHWLGRDFRVFYLNVSEDTAKDRLNKRRDIEGRKDDEPEIMEERFKNFYSDTAPAIEYFRSIGKVMDIDGEPLPEEVFNQVWEKVSSL